MALLGLALTTTPATAATARASGELAPPPAVAEQVLRPGEKPAVASLAGLDSPPAARGGGPLAREVASLAGLMGTSLNVRDVAAAIASARLPVGTEHALGLLVTQLRTCTVDTQRLLGHTSHRSLLAGQTVARAADRAAIHTCAVGLRGLAQQLAPALRTGAGRPLTLWPVLSYAPGASDDTYVEDYALQIDSGGNDTYRNNAGGNQLDLKRSVSSPAAPKKAPARGCAQTYPDSVSGRVVRGPGGTRQPSYDGPECVPLAALLLDQGGNDTYGALAAPTYPDTDCSNDASVPRMATIGAGVEGAGVLLDTAGNDTYRGRTVTMGAGHLGGVGLLEDQGGNDRYTAIRNAQGLGLLGGVGILRDHAGRDRYDFYMPRPLNLAAKLHEDGSGGVVDDSGLGTEAGIGPHRGTGVGGRCDALPRSLQGVGILLPGSLGVLADLQGHDVYRAEGYANQDSGFPLGAPVGLSLLRLAHGSQASGFLGGAGALFDLDGHDRYLRPDGTPAPDRGDRMSTGPKVAGNPRAPGFPDNGQTIDISVFHDAE